ncbi:MAG TPA: serine/threonine-protein kinase [Kofleriaceae bacterium]|jgi:serine/threonine protein kinase
MANQPAQDGDQDPAHDATRTASYRSDDIDRDATQAMPARVGRYEICEVLGVGAMGVVYRARDPELDRPVAIKVVRSSNARPSSGVRLLREAQAMARLRHPNVVPIFDVGPADSAVFVAMPLLDGGTLRSWLGDHSRSFDAILDRFVAAGRGLAAAHAAGLVHRDFKPDNVLLGSDGEVHVADFGLARLADDDVVVPGPSIGPLTSGALTQTGAVLGTPAYMAPEQLRGRPSDARADQFSFCVSLWEGLYGERPFPDPPTDTEHVLRARIETIAAGPVRPPARRHRPAWIAPLLVRGLAADPDQRWPSLQALLDAITAHRGRRRRPWWRVAGLAAVCAAVVIAVLARPTPTPRFYLSSLTHRGDLQNAAISPDGSRLAIVAGDSLVLQGSEPEADNRVVIEHGVTDESIAWSPDSRRVLVTTVPETSGQIDTELVDIIDGVRFKLPTTGSAAFLSSSEVATMAYRQRTVAIFAVGGHAPVATCAVPGDYTFLWHLLGLADGTMVVETLKGETHALVILGRDCSVRATFSAEPISSVALSDTRTIIALVGGEGFGEILELSLDGAIVSRRRVSSPVGRVLGRRRGTDYVSTFTPRTHLVRVQGNGAPVRQFSFNGSASFSLAPDGETLAWIERGVHGVARGQLRLSTVSRMLGPRALLDNALMAGWSPDGRSLAVLVDNDAPGEPGATPRPGQEVSTSLVIVDRSGSVSRRMQLDHVGREAAPVWLDDHRIAVQSDDRTTYRWFDLTAGDQGEIVDTAYGSTYWLARSPRDGTLAMWRNGPPAPSGVRAEHLWLRDVGHPARPLHVDDAMKHFLVPSWSPSGELVVRALETGVVSRVALDTGELTPFARLPPTPLSRVFDDHLMFLADGDLLGVEVELGVNVAVVYPDDEPPARRPHEPVRNPL